MRIYLIGLPGVGKSTIGKRLAKQLDFHFIDLDHYIEEEALMFVDEIFVRYGEEYFRALESNALASVSKEENIVVSCGGGIIKNVENKRAMTGICIYLRASLEEIQLRLDESRIERPLLISKTVKDLYAERKSLYEAFADLTIENSSIDQTIAEIMERIQI